jgi:hypothetical protein
MVVETTLLFPLQSQNLLCTLFIRQSLRRVPVVEVVCTLTLVSTVVGNCGV